MLMSPVGRTLSFLLPFLGSGTESTAIWDSPFSPLVCLNSTCLHQDPIIFTRMPYQMYHKVHIQVVTDSRRQRFDPASHIGLLSPTQTPFRLPTNVFVPIQRPSSLSPDSPTPFELLSSPLYLRTLLSCPCLLPSALSLWASCRPPSLLLHLGNSSSTHAPW